MTSSLKRSASDAFGSAEALRKRVEDTNYSSAGGGEAPKNAPDDDVQPLTKLISKIQAVELLEKLIQFVPKEYSAGSAVPDQSAFAAKNNEIADVKLFTQFKLRNLCRRFRNIIHRRTPVTVICFIGENDEYALFISDNEGTRLSRDRTLNQLTELSPTSSASFVSGFDDPSKATCGNVTLAANVNSFKLGVPQFRFVRTSKPFMSIPAVLSRLVDAFGCPCCLSLDLRLVSNDTPRCFVKEFDIPLKRQFPLVTLEKLYFHSYIFNPSAEYISSELRSLKYFLESGQHSLTELNVNIFTLMSLFAEATDGANVLPEDWTCVTLRTLILDFDCMTDTYVNDDDTRAALDAFCAKLPRVFPNLDTIAFDGTQRHCDLSFLRCFSRLTALRCDARFDAEQSLVLPESLVSINRLVFDAADESLSTVASILPSLTAFKYAGDAFEDFAQQLDISDEYLKVLRQLTIKVPTYLAFTSHTDCVSLLRSLNRLALLTSLSLELDINDLNWCPAGDLSLIQVLPNAVTNARFVFALRSTAVNFNEDLDTWSLSCNHNVPSVEETVYLDWMRALLHSVVSRSRLERFFCVCAAPSFEVLLALAENWSKSSADAITHLDIASVVHVQCTPLYARMAETRIPARGDRIRFHFVLAPRLKPTAAKENLTRLKRKRVTIEFQNP